MRRNERRDPPLILFGRYACGCQILAAGDWCSSRKKHRRRLELFAPPVLCPGCLTRLRVAQARASAEPLHLKPAL